MASGVQRAIGDAEWIEKERKACLELTGEYVEEISFLAQSDLRWLNAHMDDLLNSDKLNLAEVLKTPGKLRGKTPRTARKHDTAQRAPLTDLFAPNPQAVASPAQSTPFYDKIAKIKVAADADAQTHSIDATRLSPVKRGPYTNKDSGYHGATDEDIESYRELNTEVPLSYTRPKDGQTTLNTIKSPGPAARNEAIQVHEDNDKKQNSNQSRDDHHGPQETVHSPAAKIPLAKKGSLNFASLPPRASVATSRQSRLVQAADNHPANVHRASKSLADDRPIDSVPPSLSESKTSQGTIEQAKADARSTEGVLKSEDDDDDWIAPPNTTRAPLSEYSRALSPIKPPHNAPAARSVREKSPVARSPMKDSNLYPDLTTANTNQQRTPVASSSSRRFPDGPLSASKSKLYSVLKSAKSIFASSAGPSAQTKATEIGSPTRTQYGKGNSELDLSAMPGAFAKDITPAPEQEMKQPASKAASLRNGRVLRSSTEGDKKSTKLATEAANAGLRLDQAREKEANSAAERLAEQAVAVPEDSAVQDEVLHTKTSQASLNTSQTRTQSRLAKPTIKQQPTKPVPVNIRVPSQSQRLGSLAPTSAAPTIQEPTPVQATARQQATSNRPGATSTRAGTTSTLSTARSNKALQAAARKKELEDLAAQRQAEKKLLAEQKRRQAEEDKRAAEERKLEKLRADQARIAAKRQEDLRLQKAQAIQKARDAAEVAEREKVQIPASTGRVDGQGTLRQIGKPSNVPDVLHSKTSKRALPDDHDETQHAKPRQTRSSSASGQEAKRRRTNDVDDDTKMADRPSIMAPPKRPSSVRKVGLHDWKRSHSTDFLKESTLRYVHAPPPAQHNTQSMYKATVTAQHQLSQTGKQQSMYPPTGIVHSNARIPFAESAHTDHYASTQDHSNHQHTTKSSVPTFKTPGRPLQQTASAAHKSAQKSSPAYQNGEHIALPEIHTDSEDESDADSEDNTGGFRAPSWVASPALRDLLTQQQLVDPESVFGPIAPLQMDDVFRNGKNGERLKKFRDRGSSARWVETGDAVTAEEKKKDQEARAKMFRDGGWSYTKEK